MIRRRCCRWCRRQKRRRRHRPPATHKGVRAAATVTAGEATAVAARAVEVKARAAVVMAARVGVVAETVGEGTAMAVVVRAAAEVASTAEAARAIGSKVVARWVVERAKAAQPVAVAVPQSRHSRWSR